MAITVPIVSTFDAKGIDKSISDINKAEGGWAKAGKGIEAAAVPAAAALGAIGAASYVAVQKASDLGETFNAVNKTFGDSAGVITKYGETAAETAGLSQRAFQEMATSTGAMLTNMGYSTEEAANSTIALTERAADMASVFNTDVETALGAINAGLRGESEPLRAFGVGLSDAAVKAKAMEMGLYDGKGALDASAKALATEALVLEQTNKYAGDFADTSDSMANKQRTVQATTENLAASFGQALVPYMEAALEIGLKIVEWAGENQKALQILVGVVAAFSAAILVANVAMKAYVAAQTAIKVATTIWTGVQWLLNAALTANPIGLVIAAIALLIAGIVLAYKKSDTFRELVDGLWRILKGSVVVAFEAVSKAISVLVGWLQKAWDWIKKVLDKLGDIKPPSFSFGGLFGGSQSANAYSAAAYSAAAPTSSGTSIGSVTINVNGSGNPYETAKATKRALEGYDRGQGRTPWTPLPVAW